MEFEFEVLKVPFGDCFTSRVHQCKRVVRFGCRPGTRLDVAFAWMLVNGIERSTRRSM